MSYSDQSYYQCEDCSRGILERKNKNHCRTCGKILCTECHYSHFGYCNNCRQDFEDRPAKEKYNIMKMFQSALKSGPILLSALGAIFGIASIVLASIFLFSGSNFVLIYIAAGEFPLSLLFFWLASRVRNKNERGLAEVERRVEEFKNQISPENPRDTRSYSPQYTHNKPNLFQQTPESQPDVSKIPIHLIKDPESSKKTAYIALWIFASFILISGIIHIGLSFGWYPFIFISMGEIGFSSLLFWLGSGIKNGKWRTTRGKMGNVMNVPNPVEIQKNSANPKKSLKIALIITWVFIGLLGTATLSHFFVFLFVTIGTPLFGILSGIELVVTILLILVNRTIKSKMEKQPM